MVEHSVGAFQASDATYQRWGGAMMKNVFNAYAMIWAGGECNKILRPLKNKNGCWLRIHLNIPSIEFLES
jgi:hypothetical protein